MILWISGDILNNHSQRRMEIKYMSTLGKLLIPLQHGPLQLQITRYTEEKPAPSIAIRISRQIITKLLSIAVMRVTHVIDALSIRQLSESAGLFGSKKMNKNSLKEIRENLLISKAELSRKADISPLTITRIEQGKPCRMETKRKIVLALGLKLSDRNKVFH